MSRLDELIQELCPDGVAYKTLNEICNISAGGDVPKDTFSFLKKRYPGNWNLPENCMTKKSAAERSRCFLSR